jgi:hypothetical protein
MIPLQQGDDMKSWNDQAWLRANPFLDSFMQQEVAFYAAPEYDEGGVVLVEKEIQGIAADYLNKNYRLSSPPMPILFIDRKLWMSLSYMEIQSQYLPILLADGHVGTCGLGLGYYTLRVAGKPTVEKVTVFEKEQRVIDFFNKCFHDREGFDKIEIVQGDARKKCRGYDFDFLYVDIYRTMLPDEAISDIRLFNRANNIAEEEREEQDILAGYHFWGHEKMVLDGLLAYGIIDKSEIPWVFMDYFRKWRDAPLGEEVDGIEDTTMGDLYDPCPDEDFVHEALEEMGYEVW